MHLAMMFDNQKTFRKKAYLKIQVQQVQQDKLQETKHAFVMPSLNCNAKTYFDLVNWNDNQIT